MHGTGDHAPAESVASRRLGQFTLGAAVAVMALGALTVLSYVLGMSWVQARVPGGLPMAASTGLGFCLAGLSLYLLLRPAGHRARLVGWACTWAVLALALGRLTSISLGTTFFIDAFFPTPTFEGSPVPASMALFSAIGFLLVGASLVLVRSRQKAWVRLAQAPALLAISLAFLSAVGHGYGVKAWLQALPFFPMAAHTSLAFLLLASGILFSRRDMGAAALLLDRGAGGTLLRRLPPAFVIAPVLLGWMCLYGELFGLWDYAFGVALLVSAMVAVALVLLWRNAQLIRSFEADTHRTQLVLAAQNDELRRLASGLQAANSQLIEADQHKDEFLSVVSHELRTPLNFIQGFASLLEDEVAGPLSPQQHQYMDKILLGSDRMLGLVEDLLDVARISAGRIELSMASASYEALVEGVIGSLRPLATEKEQTLTADVVTSGGLTLDATRMTQVITNLVANAIKFTPEGGTIAVVAHEQDGSLVTEVRDSGVGIPPEHLPRLFQRFYQVDMGNTREVGGSGLGLAIARALVEAHGGTITVTSRVGKGTTFRVTLPLIGAAVA